ncbi:MAG: aspartate--tRNA(Asn) ligase [Candidatus Aenigmatarchaeota archaeon]
MIESLNDWKRTHYSRDVTPSMADNEVIVMGWCREIRDIGKLKFIKLADREGFVQVIVKKDVVKPEVLEKIDQLGREDVVAVKAIVKSNPQAPGGRELIPLNIKILSVSERPLPLEIETKKTPAEFTTRLDSRFMDLRKPEVAAIFKVRDASTTAIRSFLESQGFIEINTPKIIAQASEGGAEVFKVKYFDTEAYLAQSPQFYKQMMMAAGFDRVYEIGSAFRAEKSHTTRHLTEIMMLDLEMSFINSLEDVMNVVEGMMFSVCDYVSKNEKEALEILGKTVKVPAKPFPRITMDEAKTLLKEKGLKYGPNDELDAAGERALGEVVKEKFDNEFVFLTEFPWKQAKFYHKQSEKNPSAAERCDLIYNGVEISTITLREYRYDKLMEQAKAGNVDTKKIDFYLNAFRYGMPPHGGCGVGIDRIVQQLLGLANIQEAVLFPRTPDRLVP